MSSKFKSLFKNSTNSIKHSKLGGLRDTIRTHVPNTTNDDAYGSNEYIHGNFFDDKNYLSIIKCIDGGYQILDALAKYMQEYNDLCQKRAEELTSLTNRWKSKLKHQAALSSYHTTKKAQKKLVNAPLQEAEILEARYQSIQKVIEEFRNEINKLYSSERSGSSHKHCRTEALTDSFEAARSQLIKLSNEMKKLEQEKSKTEDKLHEIMLKIEGIQFSYPVNEAKLEKENNKKETLEKELKSIEGNIERIEQESETEKKTYHKEATRIYEKCRALEQERLDLIGVTIIKFVEVVYAAEHFDKQTKICDELKVHFESERNTFEDLDFWAKTYGVRESGKTLKTQKSRSDESATSKTENRTTITDENRQQSVTEGEEEISTSAKRSSHRRNKN